MFAGVGIDTMLFSVGDRAVLSGDANQTVGGYERIDLGLHYAGVPGLDLSLRLRNLLDDRYIERSNGSFGYGHSFGSPRAVLFRVEYAFDSSTFGA